MGSAELDKNSWILHWGECWFKVMIILKIDILHKVMVKYDMYLHD